MCRALGLEALQKRKEFLPEALCNIDCHLLQILVDSQLDGPYDTCKICGASTGYPCQRLVTVGDVLGIVLKSASCGPHGLDKGVR